MKRKQKPARNPKPISKGPGPITNRRVKNEPLKPARRNSYTRTRENAQDEPDYDPDASPSALAQLLDIAGPEDVSGFDS